MKKISGSLIVLLLLLSLCACKSGKAGCDAYSSNKEIQQSFDSASK
jgi:hypothetical protein